MTATMTAPRTRVDPGAMPSPPDPEVPEKAGRRRFSAEYKLAILREADACTEPGQIGALLRREQRLYSSHLVDWRRQRETGRTGGPGAQAWPQACRPNPGRTRAAAAGQRAPRQAPGPGGEDHREPGKKLRAAGGPARPAPG